ncbi:MAG: CxxC-x17-CxxC domain-containing protein, partial [Nanoarchaeota archaeon]
MGFNEGPRQGGYKGGFNSEPREMHKAICSECKKECQVPFKPTPGKDVFCQECFAKKPKAQRRY